MNKKFVRGSAFLVHYLPFGLDSKNDIRETYFIAIAEMTSGTHFTYVSDPNDQICIDKANYLVNLLNRDNVGV